MATMARAGQLIGDYMATCNSCNTYITPTNGQIIKPVQTGFGVKLDATKSNVTGDGTPYTVAGWVTQYYNRGSDFNLSTGVYTAPVNGIYKIDVEIAYYARTGTTDVRSYISTTSRDYIFLNFPSAAREGGFYSGNDWINYGGSFIVRLIAGEQVTLVYQQSGLAFKQGSLRGETYLSINLLN